MSFLGFHSLCVCWWVAVPLLDCDIWGFPSLRRVCSGSDLTNCGALNVWSQWSLTFALVFFIFINMLSDPYIIEKLAVIGGLATQLITEGGTHSLAFHFCSTTGASQLETGKAAGTRSIRGGLPLLRC